MRLQENLGETTKAESQAILNIIFGDVKEEVQGLLMDLVENGYLRTYTNDNERIFVLQEEQLETQVCG